MAELNQILNTAVRQTVKEVIRIDGNQHYFIMIESLNELVEK
jgi:hypothetical protein